MGNKMMNHGEELDGCNNTIANEDDETLIIAISGATRSGKSTLSESLFIYVHQCILQYGESLNQCSDKQVFLKLKLIQQDKFFRFKKPIHEETGYENWESTESVDFDSLEKQVQEFLAKPSFAKSHVSEDGNGNGAAHDDNFFSLRCGRHEERYLFPASKSERDGCALNNRPTRIKRILLIEGFLLITRPYLMKQCDCLMFIHVQKEVCKERRLRTMPVPDDYFEKVIWPSYQLYNRQLIDGTQFVHNMTTPVLYLDGCSNGADAVFKQGVEIIQPLLDKLLEQNH